MLDRGGMCLARCRHQLSGESILKPIQLLCAFLTVAASSAVAQTNQPTTKASAADNQPAPMIMLVPVEISAPAMKSGCWAQFFDERNFKGDMFTIAGPIQ